MELAEARRRAEHESAHVVSAVAQGLVVNRVTLETTDCEPVPAEPGVHAALKVIAVLLAGEVADPVEGHARALGIECDFDRAFRVARRAVSPEHTLDLMRAGRQRAEALLAANADLHQRLVAALLERGELGAEEINQLHHERQLEAA